MAELICPQCEAGIEADLVERTGRRECPFCHADLSHIEFPAIASPETSVDEGFAPSVAAGVERREIAPPPAKSAIQVVESTADRLLVYVPAGGKRATGLGCFALVWNLFMCVFTPPWFFAGGGNGPPMLVLVPFLLVFWAVGLTMAFFWMKMRFERTFLLVEPGRAVIQKTLFNRKRVEQTALDTSSRAALVESYQQNDTPVYRIEITGTGGALKFGTALTDPEKDWLVDQINAFLGAPPEESEEDIAPAPAAPALHYPESCPKCGAPLSAPPADGAITCAHCGAIARGQAVISAAEPVQTGASDIVPLDPSSLPADSIIRILEDTRERLRLSYSLGPPLALRIFLPLFLVPFSIAWYGGVVMFVVMAWKAPGPGGVMSILFTLFAIPFFIAGLMPFGLALVSIFGGTTTVDLTSENLSCRWGSGPFGFTRKMPTASIESVRVESGDATNPRRRRARRVGVSASGDSKACVVRGGGRMILLTLFQGETAARQVAALLRGRLARMGHTRFDG
jgi:uncharacterized Zn finger protein (UPF0148 family)